MVPQSGNFEPSSGRRGESPTRGRALAPGALLLLAAVDGGLQTGAGGELRGLAGLDLHGLARLRVAARAGGALGHRELAEAGQRDLIALLEGLLDGRDDRL